MVAPKQCEYCGREFVPKESARKFCDAECYHLSTRKGEMRQCVVCGEGFYLPLAQIKARGDTARHCSKVCEGRGRKKTLLNCAYCGEHFYAARLSAKYCNNECYFRSLRTEKYPVRARRRGSEFSRRQKALLLKRSNGRCQVCDTERGLEYDHIVPVFSNGSNSIKNGQVLCHECHLAKTILERGDSPRTEETTVIVANYLDAVMAEPPPEAGWGLGPAPQ